jgi:hypothetical protein
MNNMMTGTKLEGQHEAKMKNQKFPKTAINSRFLAFLGI